MRFITTIAVVASVPSTVASSGCPSGWTGGSSSKCLQIFGRNTHAGCATTCGSIGGSLACIQTAAEDDVLVSLIFGSSGGDMTYGAWVGEFQSPFEPSVELGKLNCPYGTCHANMFGGVPYNGQTGWGTCSNGQTTNYSIRTLDFFQPNNFNGAEDCMGRYLSGLGDQVCNLELACACEHGAQTTADYLAVHGPALTQRSRAALDALWSNWQRIIGLAVLFGSLPALAVVLLIECYLVRWRQRMAPTTPSEASLQRSLKLAHRRRMLQTGLSLWSGGVLFAVSVPAHGMFEDGSWPCFGWTFPTAAPIIWSMLQFPGAVLIMLTIRPSDTLAIRLCALLWSIFVAVRWGTTPEVRTWAVGPRSEAADTALSVLKGLGLGFSLLAAVFWRPARVPRLLEYPPLYALPGRIALRLLWYCVRLETIVGGIEYLLDSEPYLDTPLASVAGTPMIVAGSFPIVFAVVLGHPVRRWCQGLLGGLGQKAHAASAATVVATMVNGDAVTAVRDAHGRLYTIKISTLVEADMANNQDSGLFQKTEKANAGECDAFLSHSWRDDPPRKWAAMLEFKAEFEAQHDGREPCCWLDKVGTHIHTCRSARADSTSPPTPTTATPPNWHAHHSARPRHPTVHGPWTLDTRPWTHGTQPCSPTTRRTTVAVHTRRPSRRSTCDQQLRCHPQPRRPRPRLLAAPACQACIDQASDINASLKALPIFLLSSKCMVVFVGESYFRRMW